MSWKTLARSTAISLGLAFAAVPAMAASFDFTTLGSNNIQLANTVTVAGITVTGYNWGTGSSPTLAPLWLRNQPSDHGIGVCTEGTTTCSTGGGDQNELSSLANQEAIKLTKATNQRWTSLWISSLDSGGDGGSEEGVIRWGANFSQSAVFIYGTTCNVECDLFTVLGAAVTNLFQFENNLLFLNNGGIGTNNDYLIWKGATVTRSDIPPVQSVPEPASLTLLGAGLLGIGMVTRRRGS